MALCVIGFGCSKSAIDPYDRVSNDFPRMVVSGKVSNESGEALSGIYVAVYGVRDEQEADILTYNYAITDAAGEYMIIRYRGREVPMEVTVVATDSTNVYKQQSLSAQVSYDTVYVNGIQEPYNAFVTADFILTK